MTLRCNCSDAERAVVDGGWRDPVVFGSCRTCQPESTHAANIADELDRLEREDPEVQAASDRLSAVGEYIKGRLPSAAVRAIYDLTKSVQDVSGLRQSDFTLSPPVERDGPVLRDPYDMDDDERRGF